MLKDRQQAKEHNNFWLTTLFSYYYSGINSVLPENYENLLSGLTVADVQNFTKNLLNNTDIMDIVFVPKAE